MTARRADAADSHLVDSLPSAIDLLTHPPPSEEARPLDKAFLIGGAQLYSHALHTPHPSYKVDRVLLTRLESPGFECDVFVPELADLMSEGCNGWRRASDEEMDEWVGFEVEKGTVVEMDRTGKGEVRYRFEMWCRH